MIPQAAPMLRLRRYASEVNAAIGDVLAGDALINGPRVLDFERAFAARAGVSHCVGVNSGTDALAFALRACGVGPGKEVITVALTAAATAQAILHCGAIPHFVDVDPNSWVMDPSRVEAAVNDRTAAIVPVHLYGYPAPADVLRKIADDHRLVLVEDCAQAHGASLDGRQIGTFGHAAAYSFYPTKNLGAPGDGGAVTTNDADIAERIRSMRSYGWTSAERISATIGFNSRLDELHAAVLLALLPHLDEGNRERRIAAERYRSAIGSLPIRLPAEKDGAVYHQFAIRVHNRDQVAETLKLSHGVLTAVHYTPPLHQHSAFSGCPRGTLDVTERLASELLSLPIQPEVVMAHLAEIVDALTAVLSA